jgi:alkanesulfonate monooxygenase SsuD/methylene tetrahydromethanopterin reductase-like flavin-dependent oxidoreductase (luciferase family)
MRHALNLPLFGPLADPATVVEIGRATEENGWDGLFVWDHVLSPIPDSWKSRTPG